MQVRCLRAVKSIHAHCFCNFRPAHIMNNKGFHVHTDLVYSCVLKINSTSITTRTSPPYLLRACVCVLGDTSYAMTVVSPRELASMMMGVWFLSSFLGNYLSGELGALYAYMEAPRFFALMALLAAGVSSVMLASSRPLMHLLDPSRL